MEALLCHSAWRAKSGRQKLLQNKNHGICCSLYFLSPSLFIQHHWQYLHCSVLCFVGISVQAFSWSSIRSCDEMERINLTWKTGLNAHFRLTFVLSAQKFICTLHAVILTTREASIFSPIIQIKDSRAICLPEGSNWVHGRGMIQRRGFPIHHWVF